MKIAALTTLLAALALHVTAGAQEIVTLAVRDGATQSFLLLKPAQERPVAAVVLFPGGGGSIRLREEDGRIRFGEGNFLVRTRERFVGGGLVAAVMDAPSDQSGGMEDWFRLGDKHASDIGAVVAEIKKRFDNPPVYLVGTSRGTVSAANGGRALGDKVAGVVLTSSLFIAGPRAGQGLSGFNYGGITAPLLLVHHRQDACRFTPYSEAQKLAAARKYALVSVDGGKPATSEPCEAFSAHGYLGREPETVEAIVNWILKKPYRDNIE